MANKWYIKTPKNLEFAAALQMFTFFFYEKLLVPAVLESPQGVPSQQKNSAG
jgi:hypothetical protein